MGTTTADLTLTDGRTLRVHDSGAEGFPVIWHHGTPQSGRLLGPVAEAATARGFRVVSYGRPGYGGSTPNPGRTVGSAADDVRQLADALGLSRFATMGASSGGTHALACAAAMPDRVTAVVGLGAVAPFSEEYDWYAGMADDSSLRAAREGRDIRLKHGESHEFDESSFIAADWAALSGPWSALGRDAGSAGDVTAEAEDDLALTTPWGVDLAAVKAPVLLAHGAADRVIPVSHSHWLLKTLPNATLWLHPKDGHISVLNALPTAFDWLRNLPASRL
ncbi:alpha/beta fold hydrolase [Amycolatopsis benzoatilytica]|uniref:alpha/beta fold hydrolase n=1 Tax=Amycolatopsis benzoatilytica TaxID=346045 RepID=UPI0003622FD1|nr:alpha/beta hydrolase [Amycolatopsis benzoatilytica]